LECSRDSFDGSKSTFGNFGQIKNGEKDMTVKIDITPKLQLAAEEQIVDQTKRIDYYITEYSIELLAIKMHNGDFDVPDYQREYTWEPARKSRFIESILMNLPVPFLFFWENPKTGKLEIVDGSQRLRTIEEFILGDLKLGELAKMDKLSGFCFKDLSDSRQRKLKNRSIRGIILNEHADNESRFDLFDRINTGSKTANPAEIRRGAIPGPFMDMIINLATSDQFKHMAPLSSKAEKERDREELVLRFFAYGDGLEEYNDNVTPFLFDYTRKMTRLFAANPSLEQEYRKRFQQMLDFVEKGFPYGFKRSKTGKATPKTRFESIALGTYLALTKIPDLQPNIEKVKKWIEDEEYQEVIGSDGANAIGRLKRRMEYVRDHLLKD
jgi:hypothetical protein